MNAIEQIHNKSRNIIFECLCHGLAASLLAEPDECDEAPAFVIFVNVDALSVDVLNN